AGGHRRQLLRRRLPGPAAGVGVRGACVDDLAAAAHPAAHRDQRAGPAPGGRRAPHRGAAPGPLRDRPLARDAGRLGAHRRGPGLVRVLRRAADPRRGPRHRRLPRPRPGRRPGRAPARLPRRRLPPALPARTRPVTTRPPPPPGPYVLTPLGDRRPRKTSTASTGPTAVAANAGSPWPAYSGT